MRKKLIGFMFAATMLFGASMTVFAADVSSNEVTVSGNEVISTGNVIEMKGEVKKPTLEVTITNGTKVIANPYGLANAALGLTATETLKGSTIEFENKSDTAIAVGLTAKIALADYATGTAEEDQVTVAKNLSALAKAETKQVYVEAAITNADGSKKLYNAKGTSAVDPLVYTVKGNSMSGDDAPVLAAVGDTTAESSTTMLLTLTGGTSKSPTSQWTEDDEFTVTTVYDIQFGSTLSIFKA